MNYCYINLRLRSKGMESSDFISLNPTYKSISDSNNNDGDAYYRSIPPWLAYGEAGSFRDYNRSIQTHSSSQNGHNHRQYEDRNSNISPLVKLHNEIVDLAQYLRPTTQELRDREIVIKDIEDITRKLWPTARLSIFGSQMTDLLLPNSDIDVSIMDVPIHSESMVNVVKALNLLADSIKEVNHTRGFIRYIEVISNAKFPIIKLDHSLNVSMDICINNSSGIDTGKLMNKQLQAYPMLRSLTVILKLFLAQRRMNETYSGGIGSFVLLNMIVSFLQQRQRCAVLEGKSFKDVNWNLGVLLIDFFQFYGVRFNYILAGISINNSGYYNKQDRGYEWYNPTKPMSLSVENPDPAVDPKVDIGKNSYNILKIRRSFEHAYQLLSAIICFNDPSSVISYLAYIIRADDPILRNRTIDYSSLYTSSRSDISELIVLGDETIANNNTKDGSDGTKIPIKSHREPINVATTSNQAKAVFQSIKDDNHGKNHTKNSNHTSSSNKPQSKQSKKPVNRPQNEKLSSNPSNEPIDEKIPANPSSVIDLVDSEEDLYVPGSNKSDSSPEITKIRKKRRFEDKSLSQSEIIELDSDSESLSSFHRNPFNKAAGNDYLKMKIQSNSRQIPLSRSIKASKGSGQGNHSNSDQSRHSSDIVQPFAKKSRLH